MKLSDRALEYRFWQDAVYEKDWKNALDFLIESLRDELVFDNLAIYIIDENGKRSEIAYARAIGREKNAEADASWGEEIADKVMLKNEIVFDSPSEEESSSKRVANPYLAGMPLMASGKLIGILSLIRFGGPVYTQEDISVALLAAVVIAYIFEKRALQESIIALEKVQRQMRLQDDFVSTISHELRTPLGFIKGYSTTLLRDDTEWDEETRREFLTIIDEEADHLTGLIENILESARLQSQTFDMNFQPLRLDVLVRDIITRVHARYENFEIVFTNYSEKIIQGDNTRLAQVFENLFSNTVKYAPKSKIEISIKNEDGNLLKVSFSDSGAGISEEHLPFIFDRFYRVPDQPKKAGTGLGLFISKRIIEAHHGKIWAESDAKKGTRFIILLPTEQNN
ncbi:MAG: GAF domain-containing protein [Anaerolineae bacterium]|jgi:signal transduction histidine kinase|nr:GAF domain-containing protein [Anaerolineae bacterium]MBT7076050.1 GAF domain-containing protein [Anaerolineae bacterium]MBT7782976.1 GAF domain-containing protein [Anaerolineae bacterium]